MAWLGEEVEEKAADVLAPRCVKDIIEEKLFDRGRDLFISASVSRSFYGEGGETLEARLFQGLSARSQTDDPGSRRRRFGHAYLHGHVTRQHRRRYRDVRRGLEG